ncbi:MAG: hypothetical protein Q8P21_02870 [bacterium]|nr:hypothetical protein [bacterium]
MTSQEYRSILGRLPIKNPTPQDMAAMCPHLTAAEAAKAFTTGTGYVACPPLRVRYGFQILSYHKEWVEEIKVWAKISGEETQVVKGKKNHPPYLRWSHAGRTLASYADGKPHSDLFNRYKSMDKAMKFAEDNWSDELILDDWKSVVEFYVQDPTDLVSNQYHKDYPRTKAGLYVTLNRNLNDIINDHTRPHSEHFDDAILQMTLDVNVWHELKGGRGAHIEFNCAHCSAGLGLSGCSGCGYRFRDDHFRSGWHTPLSRKMVEFLRKNGHEFKMNPEIAWANERENWERIPVANRKRNRIFSGE